MPKFYITDGDNKFLIDTNNHLYACKQAIKNWKSKEKEVGKMISFNPNGFNISGHNLIETKIVEGLDFKNG